MADATTTQSFYFLTNVDVLAPPDAAAIVTFGDSITDGAVSTPNTDQSWPSFLARRLAASGGANIAVLNQGISGNRLLRDGAGVSALARFDRDVLAQPGAKWLMILEGINDIGLGLRAGAPESDAVSADDLIAALKQLIERAHEHGIKVIGGTLTPFEGAAYYSESGETVREAVNQWIRSSARSTRWWISRPPRAIPSIPSNFARASTMAITCTQTMPGTGDGRRDRSVDLWLEVGRDCGEMT